MDGFDERYEIRLARVADIGAIMGFIGDHWKRGHVMSVDRELFEYEFLDIDGETVDFVLAVDRGTGEIEGILGFLRCSSTEDPGRKDVWGSFWKVRPDHGNMPLLGIELARRVYALAGCRYHIGNGANPGTTVILRKLYFGERTARMSHYYYLNGRVGDYRIALVRDRWSPKAREGIPRTWMRRLWSMGEVRSCFDVGGLDAVPYKDDWYFEKRYFRHPRYEYQVYGLGSGDGGGTRALLVAREVRCNGAAVLRIVDYLGEQGLFAGLGGEMAGIVSENGYEYVDFYEFGFDEAAVEAAGFRRRDGDDGNVIPNYFEPFVRENVDIWVHYKAEGTTFFKADGDQDRPNAAPEGLGEVPAR